MRLGVAEQGLALYPVHNEPVHRYRDLQLDVRRLVVSLTPEEDTMDQPIRGQYCLTSGRARHRRVSGAW